MRMTKDLAQDVARRITEKSSEYVDKCLKDVQSFVTKVYVESVPIEVSGAFKKFPDYFCVTERIKVLGTGFSYDYIDTDEDVEVVCNLDNEAVLKLNGADSNKYVSLNRKYESAKKKHREFKKEIEVSLYSLRTFSQIEKHIPEAVPFLPKSESLAVAKNFTRLRKLIQEVA